jgi:hypothetical protein
MKVSIRVFTKGGNKGSKCTSIEGNDKVSLEASFN